MKIEVGDKVIFRTDLQGNKEYGTETFVHNMNKFCNKPQIVNRVSPFGETFSIVGDDCEWSFTPEMVAEVIKPTKERMYSEGEINELIERIEAMKDDSGREGCTYGDTDFDSLSAVYGYNTAISNIIEVIQSLNK